MTNGNAYSIFRAYLLILNNNIEGLPFGVHRLASRNCKLLQYLDDERIAIIQTEGKTEEEQNEAWRDFLALTFNGQIEQLDERKIENIHSQYLSDGFTNDFTTTQVFNTILDLQNK